MRFVDPTVPELDHVNWRFGRGLIPDRTGVSSFVIDDYRAYQRQSSVYDDFNRADGRMFPSGTNPDTSGKWNDFYSGGVAPYTQLAGGKFIGNPAGWAGIISNNTVINGDGEIWVDWLPGDVTTDGDLYFHWTDPGGYGLAFGGNYCQLDMNDSGPGGNRSLVPFTLIDPSLGPSGYDPNPDYLGIGLTRRGDTLQMFRKRASGAWVAVGPLVTDTRWSGGAFGLDGNGAGVLRINNFGAGAAGGVIKRGSIAFGSLQRELDLSAAAVGWSGSIATGNPYLKSALRSLGLAETVLS